MKKIQIEKGYKYVYDYAGNGNLLDVKFYKRKFLGLVNEFQGRYEFIYQDDKLISQRNTFKDIGLTEATAYMYENDKLTRKEYYNSAMALRYYIDITYNEKNEPVKMEIHQFTGRELGVTNNTDFIKQYLDKQGKQIDFLNDMLDMANKIKNDLNKS